MAMTKPTTVTQRPTEVHYPESDGKPMAETDLHRDEMAELIALLKARYTAAGDVYVSGNLLLYYEEGNPAAAVAPDVFVVFGVPSSRRRIYKLWAEGLPPAVVIEVTSRKTRLEDLRTKMALYARLGVAEYYLYDPESDYLHPPLQAYRLAGGAYESVAPDSAGTLHSPCLRLDLRLEDRRLQLYDAATGSRLLRSAERDEALERATEAAARERSHAEAAEAQLARLRAKIELRATEGAAPEAQAPERHDDH